MTLYVLSVPSHFRVLLHRTPLLSHQDSFQEKLDELTELYWTKNGLVTEIGELDTEKKKELKLRLKAEKLGNILKGKDINDPKRLILQEQFNDADTYWKEVRDALMVKFEKLKKATEERNIVEMRLITLREHNRKITEHNDNNANNQDQIVLVPGFYNKQILVEQFEEVCQYSKELLLGNKHLGYGIQEVGMTINNLKSPEEDELRKLYNDLFSYSQKLIKQVGFSTRHCRYLKKLRKNPSWQAGGIC
ncbi:hypothetical protein BASA60_006136 [Batrachochytrium salamandrivorans]|nr:hypothetical protein BASA60_006136 [Batrachochytrium salamandrivorans]